jgi:hypothetical protein
MVLVWQLNYIFCAAVSWFPALPRTHHHDLFRHNQNVFLWIAHLRLMRRTLRASSTPTTPTIFHAWRQTV